MVHALTVGNWPLGVHYKDRNRGQELGQKTGRQAISPFMHMFFIVHGESVKFQEKYSLQSEDTTFHSHFLAPYNLKYLISNLIYSNAKNMIMQCTRVVTWCLPEVMLLWLLMVQTTINKLQGKQALCLYHIYVVYCMPVLPDPTHQLWALHVSTCQQSWSCAELCLVYCSPNNHS